jgi:hypothetical protein
MGTATAGADGAGSTRASRCRARKSRALGAGRWALGSGYSAMRRRSAHSKVHSFRRCGVTDSASHGWSLGAAGIPAAGPESPAWKALAHVAITMRDCLRAPRRAANRDAQHGVRQQLLCAAPATLSPPGQEKALHAAAPEPGLLCSAARSPGSA